VLSPSDAEYGDITVGPFAEASRDELLEVLDALGELLGARVNPR